MSDKILTEAFDKLKAIEEGDDYNTVKLVYKSMDHYMDSLETMHTRLDSGTLGNRMEELGLTGERKALIQKLAAVMEEFYDFMPGLEMQYRGDDQ